MLLASLVCLKLIEVLLLVLLDFLIHRLSGRGDDLDCDEAVLDLWVMNALHVAAFDPRKWRSLIVVTVEVLHKRVNVLLGRRFCLLLHVELPVEEQVVFSVLAQLLLQLNCHIIIDHAQQ